ELVKNASNKGKEWLHPYIDENGEFDYVITPAEQCIPIYEDKRQTKLQHMIRYYPIILDDKEVIQVELWSKQDVTYYIFHQKKLMFDMTEAVNPAPHFYFIHNDQETGYGWGK